MLYGLRLLCRNYGRLNGLGWFGNLGDRLLDRLVLDCFMLGIELLFVLLLWLLYFLGRLLLFR